MMRLLFLCLLLLLPAATAVSDDNEGSGDVGVDDEDLAQTDVYNTQDSFPDKTTGEGEEKDQLTLIVIIVAATVLTLAVAAIVTIMLVRRHMNNREQGIYSVPTEQNQKGTVGFME